MFCKQCGAAHDETKLFCTQCGASLQDEAAAPTPAPATAPASDKLTMLTAYIKKYLTFIMVGIAALALILSIMNLFNTYDVSATMSYGGEKQTSSGPVADIFESDDDGKYTMALIGNILFGVANLAIAVVAGLFFAQKQFNVNVYDKYIAPYIAKITKITKSATALFAIGAIGGATALLQIIAYAICTQKMSFFGASITVSVAAHWTTWVALFLYAILAVADKFLLSKEK
jgi:hypothetical protein